MQERKTVLFGGLFLALVVVVAGFVWYASPDSGAELDRASVVLSQDGSSPAVAMERTAWSEGEPLEITVYMSPTCGCCGEWVTHLEEHGFEVETRLREDMFTVKESFSIPRPLASCHTGLVNGYLVEGHVPAEDIKSFLQDAPDDARGLTVPAMPIGSPGMEMEGREDPYDVLIMRQDGRTTVFASHGGS